MRLHMFMPIPRGLKSEFNSIKSMGKQNSHLKLSLKADLSVPKVILKVGSTFFLLNLNNLRYTCSK